MNLEQKILGYYNFAKDTDSDKEKRKEDSSENERMYN